MTQMTYMNFKYRKISLIIIVIVIAFTVSCSKSLDLNMAEKKSTITLITKMKNGDYWNTVKMGADAAAREFGIDLEYQAPQDETDYTEQIRLMNQAIDQKVGSIVLAASDYEALIETTERAYDQKIPVIIIDSEVDSKKYYSFISTDNFEAGKKAGEEIIAQIGTSGRVAIMNFVKGSRNAQQREAGILEVFSKHPNITLVATEYCQSDVRKARDLTNKIFEKHGQINAIAALSSISAVGVAQAIHELNFDGKVKVVAFDSISEEIDFIDKNVIQTTIVQNPFTIGYLGVKYAREAMLGNKIPKKIDTDIKIITKENMYLPENQKLLFPFVK